MNFKIWLTETEAIYDPKVKPIDFQWAGDPKSMIKVKNVKKCMVPKRNKSKN